jgi:hypothetical protein
MRPPALVALDRFAGLLLADSQLYQRFGTELYWRARRDYLLALPGLPNLAKLIAQMEQSGTLGAAGPVTKELQAWLALTSKTLDYADYDLAVIDLDAALRRATRKYYSTNESQTPNMIPEQIADVAGTLGGALMDIRALEQRYGYSPQGIK